MEESSDIESLRAAYLAVVGQSGRVVSGKVMKEALHTIINTDTKTEPRQVGSVQPFSQIPSVASSRRAAGSSPIPPRAKSLKQILSPIDAAILAITEAESAANSQPAAHWPQTTIEQALQRNHDFQHPDSKSNASPVEKTGQAEAVSPLEKPGLKAAEPIVSDATRSEPFQERFIVTRKPNDQSAQAETTEPQTILASQHKPANSSERALKLPKFLVAPEVNPSADTTKPRQKTGAKSNRRNTFGVSLGSQLPPVPQDLFSDLKLSTPKSVEALIQEEEQRNAASTVKAKLGTLNPEKTHSETVNEKVNNEVFDTTSGNTGHTTKPTSFMDFLETNADTGLKAVGDVPIEGETDWVERYQRYESVWVKLFERPRLLLGFLGLGIVSCSVYIALGYWWFGGSPISQAAEPVNLLDVREDAGTGHADPTSVFNNIRSIQKGGRGAKPKGPEASPDKPGHEGILLAQATPAANGLAGAPATNETEPLKSEPIGRPDPFDPLVTGDGNTLGAKSEETAKKKDILLDLQYTGFIGDINSRDKVAIIRVSDPMTGTAKTLIKKVGEAFSVEGERLVLRSISKRAVLLSVQGETRQLAIQPYQTLKPVSQNNGGNGGAFGGPGGADSSAPGGSSAPGFGSSSAGGGGNGDPSRVYLNEPKN